MISTSCKIIAEEVLEQCLAGSPPKTMPRALLQEPNGHGLFGILAEGLADRFEPKLCDAYARLFSQAVAHALEAAEPAGLVARYERVRRVRPIALKPRRVFVLSRVTLGADVAVTSVLLAAAKRRFPHAEVVFVGPAKNHELFIADPHIHHAPIEYRRGSLAQRLAIRNELQDALTAADAVVLDSDSRLTQLGLLPVSAEEHYHLFESRSYGGESTYSLPELAALWAAETLGAEGAKPYISLGRAPKPQPYIAVSLGVGDNPAKRLPDPFEPELLKLLAAQGTPLCIDKGAGGEEARRVERAVELAGRQATFWEGSFAGFANIIASSRLYVGYDSAGQHVAAAAGVPLISIFAGFPVPRMFERWKPIAPQAKVIRVDKPEVEATLARVADALADLSTHAKRA